jgi:hypothetical protein
MDDEAALQAITAAPRTVKPLGPVPYILAAMSVAPGLGVLLGPIALLWGLLTLKRGGKVVAILGGVGFCGQALFFIFVAHRLLS